MMYELRVQRVELSGRLREHLILVLGSGKV